MFDVMSTSRFAFESRKRSNVCVCVFISGVIVARLCVKMARLGCSQVTRQFFEGPVCRGFVAVEMSPNDLLKSKTGRRLKVDPGIN